MKLETKSHIGWRPLDRPHQSSAAAIRAGTIAQPGKNSLATSGETRLIGQIDERTDLSAEGMRAVASANAFPTQKFDAELIYLAPSVDVTRGYGGGLDCAWTNRRPFDDMTVSAEVVVVARKANAEHQPARSRRGRRTAGGAHRARRQPWADRGAR